MESLRNALIPKTLGILSLVAVTVWSVIGVCLISVVAFIEGSESNSRFRCDISNTKPNEKADRADFIEERYLGEYEQKYIKLPFSGFVAINFIVIGIIPFAYSLCVKSRIHELGTRNADSSSCKPKSLIPATFPLPFSVI